MKQNNRPKVFSYKSRGLYWIHVEGELNALNCHYLRNQLDRDEITHYHTYSHPNPGLIQQFKPFFQSTSHIQTPIPLHLVFDFHRAKIDTSVATTCLEVQDYAEKKGSEVLILPGPNTQAVFDCLKLDHKFNFQEIN